MKRKSAARLSKVDASRGAASSRSAAAAQASAVAAQRAAIAAQGSAVAAPRDPTAAQGGVATQGRGRPREFDVDAALEQALKVFWAKGYEGTTLPDLTEAMGINRPSLYAAFGNKESLFRKVLERYRQGPVAYVLEAMEAKSARAVAQKLLAGTVEALTDPNNPRGCMVVQGALAGGESAQAMRKECISLRATAQTALRERLERAKSEGDLPRDCSPADLARYIATVMHGMTIQAASGASKEELRGVAKMALRAWPA